MPQKPSVYLAAALFNARETYFNSCLVERLENLGYQINFPQRDGFEFGNLKETLKEQLPETEISMAISNIIYFLDMGVLLSRSDVILANLDEPLDDGVLVEATYASSMGKFVIGLRTDVRNPYGNKSDEFGGMHFFPANQTHRFIDHYMPSCTPVERESQMKSLVLKIDKTIKEADIIHQEELPDYVLNNPNVSKILKGANLLFAEIEDVHSSRGMKIIASRYIENKKVFESIRPEF